MRAANNPREMPRSRIALQWREFRLLLFIGSRWPKRTRLVSRPVLAVDRDAEAGRLQQIPDVSVRIGIGRDGKRQEGRQRNGTCRLSDNPFSIRQVAAV